MKLLSPLLFILAIAPAWSTALGQESEAHHREARVNAWERAGDVGERAGDIAAERRDTEAEHAEDIETSEAAYGATAVIPQRPQHDPLDDTAAGTAIRARPHETTREALERAPGANVARSGGLGSFSALRLRGTELSQTEVYLGDIPLGGVDGGPFDLGALSPTGFESLQVYRGGAPAWLSSGALGGVLQLRPAHASARRAWASLGGGSFASWRLAGGASVGANRTRANASVALEGSRNDYPYLHDGGTGFDASDDVERHRSNAEQIRATGLLHIEQDLEDGQLSIALWGSARQGGEPGAGLVRATQARRNDSQLFLAGHYRRDFGAHRFHLAAGGGTQRRQFDDRIGEIGFGGVASDDRYDHAFVRAGTELRLHRAIDLNVVGFARLDAYRPEDSLGPARPDVHRWTGGGSAEVRMHGDVHGVQLELRPSLRVEATRIHELEPGTQMVPRRTMQPSFRVGALVAPTTFLAVVGSVSRGRRLPTLLELFGDRGALVASPDLQSETGRTIDGGIVMRGQRGALEAALESRVFHIATENLIRFIPTSQFTAVARNVDAASILGLESGGRVAVFGLELDGAMTWMSSDDGKGRALNWRPRIETHAGVRYRSPTFGAVRALSVDVQLRHRGAFFNDPANFVEVPAMSWLDIGATLALKSGIALDLRMRDALDQRGADFVGYPLPGRQVMATLRIERDL